MTYSKEQVLELLGDIVPELNDIRYNLLSIQTGLSDLAKIIELSGAEDVSPNTDGTE